jgi:GNAT superfamily N-acetyltransferase
VAVTVRRIRAGEGARLRDLRLRALEDAPTAFASLLDQESDRSLEAWEADASVRSDGLQSADFFAEAGSGVVGLVGAYRATDVPATVELVSMWVEPSRRAEGVGARLVEAVFAWARDTQADRVALRVTRGNEPAIALYSKTGFVPTVDVHQHPSQPCHEELRMVCELGDRQALTRARGTDCLVQS